VNHYRIAGALLCVVATSVMGQNYDLSWHSIDGGGVMRSTGGDFELSGTIGQPDAGVLVGGDFTLSGGFWFETVSAHDLSSRIQAGILIQDLDQFEGERSIHEHVLLSVRGGELQPHENADRKARQRDDPRVFVFRCPRSPAIRCGLAGDSNVALLEVDVQPC